MGILCSICSEQLKFQEHSSLNKHKPNQKQVKSHYYISIRDEFINEDSIKEINVNREEKKSFKVESKEINLKFNHENQNKFITDKKQNEENILNETEKINQTKASSFNTDVLNIKQYEENKMNLYQKQIINFEDKQDENKKYENDIEQKLPENVSQLNAEINQISLNLLNSNQKEENNIQMDQNQAINTHDLCSENQQQSHNDRNEVIEVQLNVDIPNSIAILDKGQFNNIQNKNNEDKNQFNNSEQNNLLTILQLNSVNPDFIKTEGINKQNESQHNTNILSSKQKQENKINLDQNPINNIHDKFEEEIIYPNNFEQKYSETESQIKPDINETILNTNAANKEQNEENKCQKDQNQTNCIQDKYDENIQKSTDNNNQDTESQPKANIPNPIVKDNKDKFIQINNIQGQQNQDKKQLNDKEQKNLVTIEQLDLVGPDQISQDRNFNKEKSQIRCIIDEKDENNQEVYVRDQQKQKQKPQQMIKVGIKNKGNTCYINSALQMIRQIWNIDQNFLNQNSKFAKTLENFYQNLEKQQNYDINLQKIINQVQKTQIHEQKGGDSFITVLGLLQSINEELYDDQNSSETFTENTTITKFEKYFSFVLVDGLMCLYCKEYMEENEFEIDRQERIENFLEISCLEQLKNLPSQYGQKQYKLQCQNCKSMNFQPKQFILFFPQFFILKFEKVIKKCDTDLLKKKIITLKDKNQNQQTYQLIGYCNYTGRHYTYTADYFDTWITFSDSQSKETKFNLNQALFLLFEQKKK